MSSNSPAVATAIKGLLVVRILYDLLCGLIYKFITFIYEDRRDFCELGEKSVKD